MSLNDRVSAASAFQEKLARSRQDQGEPVGQLLQGFREYLLAVAHGELAPELRKRLGPSDVVQETFAQAAKRFVSFEGTSETELRAWLRTILINRCRTLREAHVLTAKRDARREVEVPPSSPDIKANLVADDITPSRHAMLAEDVERLMAAMSLLSEDARQAVWLRNWEGLGFEEIGTRLGRTAEAARKTFTRAIQKLATLLEASDGEPRSS